MSNNYDGSSSSDEEFSSGLGSGGRINSGGPKHPMFHVQLPTNRLNLEEVRKQNHIKHEKPTIVKTTAGNFAKVKKITTGTNKNFGITSVPASAADKSNFKKSFLPPKNRNGDGSDSSSSSSDSDNDGDDDASDRFVIDKNDDKRMKNFTFNSANPLPFADNPNYYNQYDDDDDSEEDDNIEDETNADFAHFNPPQQFYQTDSSDEEEQGEGEENRNSNQGRTYRGDNDDDSEDPLSSEARDQVPPIISRHSSQSVRSGHSMRSSHSGASSSKKSSTGTGGGIKGILRKMSLVDRFPNDSMNQDMSHNDTFLGKVLNFGNSQSISGGGLAPGATKASHDGDEEKRVGFEDTEGIEMQPLNDYNELSEEAKDLINQHIPGLSGLSTASQSAEVTPSESPKGGSYETMPAPVGEDANGEQEKSRVSTSSARQHKDGNGKFYTPNPDIFRRGSEDLESPEVHGEEAYKTIVGDDYIAPPKQVQAGVLSSLLKLYQNPQDDKSISSLSRATTAVSSYDDSYETYDADSPPVDLNKLTQDLKETPKNMFNKTANFLKHPKHHHRTNTAITGGSSNLEEMFEKGSDIENDEEEIEGLGNLPSFQNAKPKIPKKKNPDPVHKLKKMRHNKRKAERLRITVHIADILQRQRFIMNMCKALMLFGAPTHRLEEYMVMTSRVLEIDGQFIYFPGCMIISFGDAATRTSEVHLVRCDQGLNLSKLADTHKIYKSVVHDLIGVEEASQKLDDLLKSKNRYPAWLCVLFYALGSGAVTVWAFDGGWLDIPICFGIGLCVGYLLYYVSPMSSLYSSIFEVSSAIVVSFIGRGIASVRVNSDLFCFSAITQGSLAIILPGYIILCGSLELQSRNLVAGAVRMFYAIIYSLFLGFGITLGAALYGWIDKKATSDNSCESGHNIDDKWRILFVPLYASLLGLLNQARWTEVPIMVLIAGVGYIGTYFAGKHFSQVTEFTACIGAFIIGILGNMYSRIWKGMAVSAMLPAIFVQVPSGIASKSTLISGLQTADQITNKNGSLSSDTGLTDGSSLSFGASMVEVSIGISVGLFAAAIVVYPFGKKRTGIFAL